MKLMLATQFDITIDGAPRGRLEFALWDAVVPRTARNFRELCTGVHGFGYAGSSFHRAIPGFMLQGGDFTVGNGMGGKSIYGAPFADENLTLKHDRPFLLSMANAGRDTNGSQFLLTTAAADWLDGRHVVFGELVQGKELVRQIEALGSSSGRINRKVTIARCGIV